MLQALIETYLRQVGFTTYERDGETYWGHPSLGHGRTFDNALLYALGCERSQPRPCRRGSFSL
jgi:hypothetical protein